MVIIQANQYLSQSTFEKAVVSLYYVFFLCQQLQMAKHFDNMLDILNIP